GDVLSISPNQLERYLSASRRIATLAVGDPQVRPAIETFPAPKYLTQDERISEDFPFGARGGFSIGYYFPADGEYVFKVRLVRNVVREMIIGLSDPHQMDLRLDGAKVKTFTVGGGFKGKRESIYGDSYN